MVNPEKKEDKKEKEIPKQLVVKEESILFRQMQKKCASNTQMDGNAGTSFLHYEGWR